VKYRWKSWGNSKVKAEIVGQVIEKLHDKHQGVTPELLVREARKARSPIHNLFEWDDTAAAKAYRVHQARLVLNHIEVVIERSEDAPLVVRAFHNVITPDEQRIYTTIASARNNEELWTQIKQEALRQIKNWQETYRDITEFEAIHQAIDAVS
jgi:hypothetical protein